MRDFSQRRIAGWLRPVSVSVLIVAIFGCAAIARADNQLSFNRDIRPILSGQCFYCHGLDDHHRQAELRLDERQLAIADRGGYAALVPGDADASELIRRIVSVDPSEQMPPPESGKQITPEQLKVLKRWIDQGADYEPHWAFIAPNAVDMPPGDGSPIDRFVRHELSYQGLPPSPRADKATLLRRVTLDLTGLPPTLDELSAFLADESPEAYANVVDRLLASSACAERLAQEWLDVARFADTNGFSIDDHRDAWIWRDWVIKSFLDNKPYDQFLTEQIAGDLLPNATDEQRLATGFLRNSMNTHEGGTIAEEYRMIYTIDKVDTVATAFMGLTVKCAQCHDHKYDPISQRDFYRFYALFDRSSEPGKGATNGNTAPVVQVQSPLIGVDLWHAQIRQREAELVAWLQELPETIPTEADSLRASIGTELEIVRRALATDTASAMVMDNAAADRRTHLRLRGQYDQLGEVVEPGVPRLGATISEPVTDRLALARWLTADNHPLTARVAVNRYWQMMFGVGLVETTEDFGTQGALPSHPALLDWLSRDFVASGWDVRRLLRQIVLSETYCQSSRLSPELQEKDPRNQWLARMSRRRLPAESIRDNALAISGLLDRALGGPSVFPPQPQGLWKEVSHYGHPTVFTSQAYYASRGSNQYRRGLYTFWKRSSPPPMFAAFDAPSRETCTVRRLETNTPLQSLVLLNDPQFFAAAQHFADRLLREKPNASVAERLQHAYRLALSREPSDQERDLLAKRVESLLALPENAESAGDTLVSDDPDAPSRQQWAWTIIASIILNLDETLTRN